MKKLLLIILSFVHLNTNPNNQKKRQIKKNAQIQRATLDLKKGKRKENLKKEIELLKKHLEKEQKNPNNSLEFRQSLESSIYSLEQDLRKLNN